MTLMFFVFLSFSGVAYYKDRDQAIVDLQDNWRGECMLLGDEKVREYRFDCDYPRAYPTESHRVGNAILWCKTNVWWIEFWL